MSKDEIIEMLLECQVSYDTEEAHIHADDLLCTFLKSLGYDDVVDAYQGVQPKWFA